MRARPVFVLTLASASAIVRQRPDARSARWWVHSDADALAVGREQTTVDAAQVRMVAQMLTPTREATR